MDEVWVLIRYYPYQHKRQQITGIFKSQAAAQKVADDIDKGWASTPTVWKQADMVVDRVLRQAYGIEYADWWVQRYPVEG